MTLYLELLRGMHGEPERAAEEIEIGRRRNRWLEDEVRRLSDLVQRVQVERDRYRAALEGIVEGTMPWADGKQRIGYYSGIDYVEHARRALKGP